MKSYVNKHLQEARIKPIVQL